MSFYDTQPRLFPRMGKTLEKPIVPPDKQALFWDYVLGIMWGVNDDMEWVRIGIDTISVQSWISSWSYLQSPDWPIMQAPVNCRVLRARLEIISVWSPGTTITIGDVLDVDRIMKSDEISPGDLGIYEVSCEVETSQTIRAFMSGSPTYGQAKITIIYDSEGYLPLAI